MGNRYRARESSSYVCIYMYIYVVRERGDFLQVKGSTPGIKMELSLSSQMQPIIELIGLWMIANFARP